MLNEGMRGTVEALRTQIEDLSARTNLLMRVVGMENTSGIEDSTRVRVPEPRAYKGAHDAKELENFLFDMEQYFHVVKLDSEEANVSMNTMYLSSDAKLWWRTRYDDNQNGSVHD